jgi:ATP-binding cassette subfamily B protein
MIRLAKYLKPYLLLLAAAVVLLVVQADANLALPDYMSRIVNVGIQQGGVDEAAPRAVRASQMERLSLFVPSADAPRVTEAYRLVEPGSDSAKAYLAEYPVLATEPVYVRKDLPSADKAALEGIMGKALLVVQFLERARTDPGQAQGMPDPGFDLSKLPKGADVFALMKMVPPQMRDRLAAGIDEKFSVMGPTAIRQAAAAPVRAEYAALGVDVGRMQSSYILRTGAFMLLLTLVAAATAIITGFISARIAAGVARDLRAAVFAKVESFSSSEFDRFSTASLITRSTNDVMQIQMVVLMMVTTVFYAPIIGAWGVVRAVGKSGSMWWLIALAVGVITVAVATVYTVAVPKFKALQRLTDRLNLVSRESLSGLMVIRAFNRQAREEERFDEANQDLTRTMLFLNRVMVVMFPFMMLVMNGLSLLIVWTGAQQVQAASLQVGDLMAFIQYAMQIVFAFLMLSMVFIMIPRAAVSAARVADVLDTDPAIADPATPRGFGGGFDGTVEFRNVTFRYPGAEEDALHDVSFVARPGQTTALIGPTGAGKSTVVNLVPRFYDVSGGAVLVGGVDVREQAQAELRRALGYVPQKSTLFSGTVGSNLRYADEGAPEGAVQEALDIAQASEFVSKMAGGTEAEIAQGGSNVSGGQKQRLSIARAVVRRPPVYLFDDSFSSLDFRTDARLRRALREKTAGATVIVVTQRIATIMNADQIIVMDDGRVVGRGTHRELMESCDTYREIAVSQLSEEELA